MPSTRSLLPGAAAVVLVGFTGVAAAQSPTAGSELGFGLRVAARFAGTLVVALLLGGGLFAVAPEYARSTVEKLGENPGSAFGWGLAAGIVVPVVLAILAATIIGLVVAIPGAIVLFVLGLVGNGVTVLWIGRGLGGGAVDGTAVGLGAVGFALLGAVPVLGDLLTGLAGLFGLGVVSRRLYRDRRGDPEQAPTGTTAHGPRN